MDKNELIENPKNDRPHVVLLGAGASRAAFPKGDISKKIPVMSDLITILKLKTIIKKYGFDPKENFEELYPQLPPKLQRKIENKISLHFSSLSLPDTATHYDRLLLSLRQKDAIFTFNWDPFLFDAYCRNHNLDSVTLPQIFFLHGNVRIGSCKKHDSWGRKHKRCPSCGAIYTDIPLLYPIKEKQYFKNSSHYIQLAWQSAQDFFCDAFTLTIFGYSAPNSDAAAKELLMTAWFKKSERHIQHIEIIDTAIENVLVERWKPFAPTHHYLLTQCFEKSRLWNWPRRSYESLFYPTVKGLPCEDFPLPKTENLIELQQYVKEIAKYEK